MAGRKRKTGDILSARVIVLMTEAERSAVEEKATNLKMSSSALLRKIMLEAK